MNGSAYYSVVVLFVWQRSYPKMRSSKVDSSCIDNVFFRIKPGINAILKLKQTILVRLISKNFSAVPVDKHQRAVQVCAPEISAIPVTDLFNIFETGCCLFWSEVGILEISFTTGQ